MSGQGTGLDWQRAQEGVTTFRQLARPQLRDQPLWPRWFSPKEGRSRAPAGHPCGGHAKGAEKLRGGPERRRERFSQRKDSRGADERK